MFHQHMVQDMYCQSPSTPSLTAPGCQLIRRCTYNQPPTYLLECIAHIIGALLMLLAVLTHRTAHSPGTHRPSIRARTPLIDALTGALSHTGQLTRDTLAPPAGEAEKPRT